MKRVSKSCGYSTVRPSLDIFHTGRLGANNQNHRSSKQTFWVQQRKKQSGSIPSSRELLLDRHIGKTQLDSRDDLTRIVSPFTLSWELKKITRSTTPISIPRQNHFPPAPLPPRELDLRIRKWSSTKQTLTQVSHLQKASKDQIRWQFKSYTKSHGIPRIPAHVKYTVHIKSVY